LLPCDEVLQTGSDGGFLHTVERGPKLADTAEPADTDALELPESP